MIELNMLNAIPYNLELRDSIGAALYRLEQLRASAVEVVRLDEELDAQARTREGLSYEVLQAKLRHQTHIFDNLEAFLAAWARVSLLLFPAGKTAFTKHRGETLQRIFGVDSASILADRDLRDAWMHHDERLDAAVEKGERASGQVFTRAADLTEATKKAFLRIIEVDNLVVYYRSRESMVESIALEALEQALQSLEAERAAAFDKLEFPEAPV